ncbi:MAG: squalene/phytoene synthase family protein, partial [Pseudomonadota bacterium]
MSAACAEIARRFDPDLHRAAMFAPEPLRARLMVLIAFDVECARALGASDQMIARMRLQWWRDRVEDALQGTRAEHEVAGPLARLIKESAWETPTIEAYFDGWETMLDGPLSAEDFETWQERRFGPWLDFAARAACPTITAEDQTALSAMGRAMTLAFVLRNAVAMAGQGMYLLPVAGLDRAALARGETTESERGVAAELAARNLEALEQARSLRVSKGL